MPIVEIPVEFNFKGKHYKGTLDYDSGKDRKYFQLMIGNRYYGQLNYMAHGWEFTSNDNEWNDKELNTFFELFIVGWFQ